MFKNKNKQILFIIFIFTLFLIISHLIIDKIYYKINPEELILKSAHNVAIEKENYFKNFLNDSTNDIKALRDSKALKTYLKDNSKIDSLEDLFLTITKSNKSYFKIKYIDNYGNEIIKIIRSKKGAKVSISGVKSLHNKADEYFFKETMIQKSEDIWFSRLELNMENNQLNIPFIPIIRAIMPVIENKQVKGMIVITYFAEDLIANLTEKNIFKIILADELGFIISHYDKNKDWGFYKKEKFNLHREFSENYIDIISKESITTKNFYSYLLHLDLFDNLYLVLQVDKKLLEDKHNTEIKKDVLKIFIFILLSTIFGFLVIKRFGNIFVDFEEQKEINHRLELASSILDMAFWEFDNKKQKVIWGQNMKAIFEAEENKDFTYDDFINSLPKEDKIKVEKEYFNSIKEKKEYSIEHRVVTKNSDYKYVQEKGIHFYDDNGLYIKTIGCTYDITQKYLAEKLSKTINKQNQELQKLFNKFDENVIASSTDLCGIITYTSKAFCEISGYTKEELLNSPQNIVRHSDTPKEVFKDLWKTIQSGNVWHGELKNMNKNGTHYWVKAVIYPEFDENNKITGYSAIRQDITNKKEVEELHKNVKSSIEVASFIQHSILPSRELLKSCFTDKFVIWEPKDVVGGDIYLLEKLRHDDECLLMVIDCTGHGVPGAFVTMLIKAIEKQILQTIFNNPDLEVSPAEILKYFNISLKSILKQEDRNLASNVGFDGGILYYDRARKILRYAGASNSLIYYDNDKLDIIKGNRQSIGYKNSKVDYEFTDYEFVVERGMKFYLFSDGYVDQIGGEKQLSFSKKRFFNIIDKNKTKDMNFQKEVLIDELKKYQNGYERIDDVTVIGLEI